MGSINQVVLVGRLTRDAELRYTNNGNAVANFSLAVNSRRRRDDQWVDEAHFFDAVMFGRSAEAVSQYLTKGKQIGIEGELRQSRWEQDGQRRSKVEIFVRNLQLLGSRGDGMGGGPSASGAPADRVEQDSMGPEPGPSRDFEDDIPF